MVHELPVSLGIDDVSYPDIIDLVRRVNGNAKALVEICMEEHLLVLKNLKIFTAHHKSKIAYRQGQL